MALLDSTGTILVDDAGLMWFNRVPYGREAGLHGLEGLGDLGFNWEGFGQAAAGIGGAVAGIIQAKKTGYAPQVGGAPIGGIQGGVSAPGLGSGGFSMSPTMMIMLALGAILILPKLMK